MAKTIMKTSLLCFILLGLSIAVVADVSPFYRVGTKVKGKKFNDRRLGDILGAVQTDSVSRGLNAGPRPDVVVGSKGKPYLGERSKGKGKGGSKGGFKYKDRHTSGTSKSSKKSSKKSGKGGKGDTGIIDHIPTQPIAPPVAAPVAAPVLPPSAISGDTPNDAIGGDTTNDAISGDRTNDAISGDIPVATVNPAISDDAATVNPAFSADFPTNDAISVDTPDTNNPDVSGDDPSGDGSGPPGALVLNFIMESTEVNSLEDQANFQLTTVLTLNGDLFDIVQVNGAPTRGPQNLGDFRGVCTITGTEHYLCSYELYFRTTGDVGAGGIIIRGPVSGAQSVAVVTGTSFDYSIYDTGFVTLTQDPRERWLIARTDLFLGS